MDRYSPGAGEPATAADREPPAPNWYPDPHRPGGFRYWDGRQWTEHTAAGPAAAGRWPVPAVSPRPDGFAVASLILGVVGGSLLAIIFGFVARGRIRRSGGARTGHGLATAGIVLGCVWMAALTVGIVLALTGALEQKNTDRYTTGEEREIAVLVDRLEEGLDDKDTDLVCNRLVTAELKEALDAGGGCADVVRSEGFQSNLKIRRLEIQGETARAVVSELGEGLTVTFLKVDGVWLVDGISS